MLYIILTVALIILASLLYAGLSLAPWLPTKRLDWERINQLAALQPGQTFLEMGCGTGALATYIAQHNPQAQVVGVELAWPVYVLAKLRQWLSGLANLRIVFGNVLQYDIANTDVVYVFARPQTITTKLKPKLIAEMKPGAQVISYIFPITDWPGQVTTHPETKLHSPIFVYRS